METAATRATRGWRGLTCGPVLSVGGARAERELGGGTKQTERSVGERATSDAEGGPVAWERPRERRPQPESGRKEGVEWAGPPGWDWAEGDWAAVLGWGNRNWPWAVFWAELS